MVPESTDGEVPGRYSSLIETICLAFAGTNSEVFEWVSGAEGIMIQLMPMLPRER